MVKDENGGLGDLYDRIGFLIRRAHQKAGAMFHDITDGITTSQYGALYILKTKGSMDHNNLAKYLHVDKTNVSVIVKSLEKYGFVSRTLSKKDKRQKILELTPSGDQAYAAIEAKARAAHDHLMSKFTDEEVKQFRIFLRRLVDD